MFLIRQPALDLFFWSNLIVSMVKFLLLDCHVADKLLVATWFHIYTVGHVDTHS